MTEDHSGPSDHRGFDAIDSARLGAVVGGLTRYISGGRGWLDRDGDSMTQISHSRQVVGHYHKVGDHPERFANERGQTCVAIATPKGVAYPVPDEIMRCRDPRGRSTDFFNSGEWAQA